MTKILNAFFNLPNSKTKFKQVFGLLMHIHMYLGNNLGREGLLSAHFFNEEIYDDDNVGD